MEKLKTYREWCPILEQECGMKIVDDDGGRNLAREGRLETPISKREAQDYFESCTVQGTASSIQKAALNRFMTESMNNK